MVPLHPDPFGEDRTLRSRVRTVATKLKRPARATVIRSFVWIAGAITAVLIIIALVEGGGGEGGGG